MYLSETHEKNWSKRFEVNFRKYFIENGVEMPEEESLSGESAPDFTLANMDGSGNVTLSELKGTVKLD